MDSFDDEAWLKGRAEWLKKAYKQMEHDNKNFLLSNTGKTKSCCGNKGFSKYITDKSQWVCSECGAIESTDPNYIKSSHLNAFEDPEYPWFTPKQVHPPETPIYVKTECTCGALHTSKPNTHSPWCDWRSNG